MHTVEAEWLLTSIVTFPDPVNQPFPESIHVIVERCRIANIARVALMNLVYGRTG